MKNYKACIAALAIALFLPSFVLASWWNPFTWNWNFFNIFNIFHHQQKPIACTQEAKICPDGSAVGRIGPNCEFAKCPEVKTTGGIKGTVLLGPTCPVMRNPPDPQCADKLYSTALEVTTGDGTQVIKQFSSDEKGEFSVDLPAGEYAIQQGENTKVYPRCSSSGVIKVFGNAYTEITVSCDTGIR